MTAVGATTFARITVHPASGTIGAEIGGDTPFANSTSPTTRCRQR